MRSFFNNNSPNIRFSNLAIIKRLTRLVNFSHTCKRLKSTVFHFESLCKSFLGEIYCVVVYNLNYIVTHCDPINKAKTTIYTLSGPSVDYPYTLLVLQRAPFTTCVIVTHYDTLETCAATTRNTLHRPYKGYHYKSTCAVAGGISLLCYCGTLRHPRKLSHTH